MVATTSERQQLNAGIKFVNSSGRLTGQAYQFMDAIAEVISAITIEDGEVTADMIAANTITADEISVKSLDADEILVDGTIITDLIDNDAVSLAALAATDGSTIVNNETEEVISVSSSSVGDRALITFTCLDGSNAGAQVTLALLRDSTEIETWDYGIPSGTSGSANLRPRSFTYVDESPGDEYSVEITTTDSCTYALRKIIVLNVKR